MAQGLKAIHMAGFIHRDIKPENILVTVREGRLLYKITDFGLSTRKVTTDTQCGTAEFMAPELIREDDYNAKVDIWSLGVVFYSLLYKKLPFADLKEIFARCGKKFSLKNTLYSKGLLKKGPWNKFLEDIFAAMFVIDPKKRIDIIGLCKML